MSFTSVIFFFAFFPAVLLLYYIITPRLKNCFILLASLAFYSFGSYKTLTYLIISCVVNWIAGLLIDELKERHKARKVVMGCGSGKRFGALLLQIPCLNIRLAEFVFRSTVKRRKYCIASWHQFLHIQSCLICS